jgi:hypothetical protein
MSRYMDRYRREVIDQYGPAPKTPAEALAHALAVYADDPDDRMVTEATNGIYGDGIRTGITLGDLRALQAELLRLRAAAEDVSGIYDDGDTYGPRPA